MEHTKKKVHCPAFLSLPVNHMIDKRRSSVALQKEYTALTENVSGRPFKNHTTKCALSRSFYYSMKICDFALPTINIPTLALSWQRGTFS